MLSWNVQGLTSEKRGCSEFVNIIRNNDIVFIYETWASSETDLSLNNYIVHNFNREFQHRHAKRNSGGLALYYRECLKDGITIVKQDLNTMVWIKLDKSFFHVDNDIYICGVYLWGEDSPAYHIINVDLFDTLENNISIFDALGDVYICGDFNSRVGLKRDYIAFDDNNSFIDDDNYTPDITMTRASLDNKCNSFGQKLLDLCKGACMRIVNGRLGDDFGVGNFTFISSQGMSLIDYLLAKECNFARLSRFTILPINEWSDHCPMQFALFCNNPVNELYYDDEIVKWNDNFKSIFRTSLIAKLPLLNNIITDVNLNKQSVSSAVRDFTAVMREVTDPLFVKHVTRKPFSNFSDVPLGNRKEWFDKDCDDARNRYLHAQNAFYQNKSEKNRMYLCCRKKEYKNLIRIKKRLFVRRKICEIEKLKSCKPKQFWKHFKKPKGKVDGNVSLNQFYSYFSQLEHDIFQSRNKDADDFCNEYDFNNCSDNESFNSKITVEEVIVAINKLNRCKASGIDGLINEYFIESKDIISGHICDIFNAIFDSGCFPEEWTKGIIIPLHKKGDKNDPNNYRGITLLSVFAKLFTSVLNNRINKYTETFSRIGDYQYGFRKSNSTVDAMFALQSIVQHYMFNNKRLYAGMIDMKKCFDGINRNALWFKLHKIGIKGKMLRVLNNMYKEVKSCVRQCNNLSEFFTCCVGLRQGEVISSALVSLFLDDIEMYLRSNTESNICINDTILTVLLFADDMVIIGDSPEDLQNKLDLLYNYCQQWSLEVNVLKTKVMVFRKRGRLLASENWTYNGNKIETVDTFNYLGTVFNYTGSFSNNIELLAGKGIKALNVLSNQCRKLPLTPKSLCQLFDAFVGSILNYSCELWGFCTSKSLERLHLKLCKRILNVRSSTCTVAVYAELGRYPLYITRFVRIIKYWCKIIHSTNKIVVSLYDQGLKDCLNGCKNWVYNVKTLLDKYGFSDVFLNQISLSKKIFPLIFKQRIIDTFMQEWNCLISNNNMLDFYKNIKNTPNYEPYLDIVPNDLRHFITKMRISAHSLRIHTERFSKNPVSRDSRCCLLCNNRDIEDVFHFICICPIYNDLRRRYLNPTMYSRPSVYKMCLLFDSKDKIILTNLALFIKKATSLRRTMCVLST